MRNETRAARRLITAAIFNKLEGPGAEPIGSLVQLAAHEPPADVVEQWKLIEATVDRLPATVVAALSDMVREMGKQTERGRTAGLVQAARIANQRLETELARDLLVEAGIRSAEDLERSGVAGDDIDSCLAIFRYGSLSQDQVAAAARRNRPTTAQGLMFKGPTVVSYP